MTFDTGDTRGDKLGTLGTPAVPELGTLGTNPFRRGVPFPGRESVPATDVGANATDRAGDAL